MMAGVTMGIQLQDEDGIIDLSELFNNVRHKRSMAEAKPEEQGKRSSDCLDSSDTKRCKEPKKKDGSKLADDEDKEEEESTFVQMAEHREFGKELTGCELWSKQFNSIQQRYFQSFNQKSSKNLAFADDMQGDGYNKGTDGITTEWCELDTECKDFMNFRWQ